MWAVVPVKQLTDCKTRLAARLDAPQRADLMRIMLDDVLRELGQVETLDGIGLATSDADVAALARERGLPAWPDRGRNVSERVQAVAEDLFAEGTAVMIVPADLPAATAEDYRELLAQHSSGLTLVASYDGGTNIVVADPGCLMPLSFGPDSLRIHNEAARALNIPFTVLEIPAFLRDIDRAEDLDWLASSAHECDARHWLLSQPGFTGRQGRRQSA